MKRRVLQYFAVCILLAALVSCGAGQKSKVESFARSFAGYVNNEQLDSIEDVYPTLNFDSFSSLPTDSISVTKEENDLYRVNYAYNKWIEVKVDSRGNVNVVESKGIASFPEAKYDIALKTGMITDNTSDVKASEQLADEAYFEWLKSAANQPIELVKGKITKTFGRDLQGRMCEGQVERMTCTVTNNTKRPISGNDYEITYAYSYWNCSDGSVPDTHTTGKKKGVDLEPGESANINIAIMDYGLKNVKIKYNVPVEDLMKGMNMYSGNEYKEYLKEKKEAGNTNYDWLSTREATHKDLENKSSEELRIMRNWIFARHGYIFKSADLQDYFSKFSWYEPTSSNVTSEFNKIEQANIALIQSYE